MFYNVFEMFFLKCSQWVLNVFECIIKLGRFLPLWHKAMIIPLFMVMVTLSQVTSSSPTRQRRCISSVCCWAVDVWSWTAGLRTTPLSSLMEEPSAERWPLRYVGWSIDL